MADQAARNVLTAAVNAIQALQTAVTGLPAAIQTAVQPVQPAAGPFLRTPLRANINVVLDYSNKEHRKAYYHMTESLFPEEKMFDVEPSQFQTFMNLLSIRARDIGLLEPGQIAMVPQDPTLPHDGPFINMIAEYGRLNLEQVQAWETTFIGNNDRMSQNSKILFDILMHSLSVIGLQ